MAPPDDPAASPFELIVPARRVPLAPGVVVRRVLPYMKRRHVGPFVFLDHMGPAELGEGKGADVGPHPHIGLSTLTYLFEGRLVHRDSLGSVQAIEPGAVNWMTAGRGVVHSERTPPEDRARGTTLHGLQFWVALPRELEDGPPSFTHHGRATLPELDAGGAHVRLLAGAAWGRRAPVPIQPGAFLADARLGAGGSLPLPGEAAERALYVVDGAVQAEDATLAAGQLAVLRPAVDVVCAAGAGGAARVVVLGGAPLDGPRHMWWNFVASDPHRIAAAKLAWAADKMGTIPGEAEHVPLPPT